MKNITMPNDTENVEKSNSSYTKTMQGKYARNHRNYSGQTQNYIAEQFTNEAARGRIENQFSDETTNITICNVAPRERLSPGREGYANLNVDWAPSGSENTKDADVLSDKQSIPSSNSSSTPNSCCSSTTSGGPTTSATDSSCIDTPGRGLPTNNSNNLYAVIPTCVYLFSNVALYMEIENTANASTQEVLSAVISTEQLGLNLTLAQKVFSLWMRSPLLELQMKPNHKPFAIRKAWKNLLGQYTQCSPNQQKRDEPKLMFQRNTFFPRYLEERIKDYKILELLYEEAKYNILEGRYPCEHNHCITLGGIQARIELGPYNPQVHSTNFFREQQRKFLPAYVRKSSNWTWLPISSKNSAEVRLLEQYKRIPSTATNRKLIRKYLEFCWSLPFYGSAFFQGQVEQPVRGITSFITHQDIPVLVAINSQGVYVIDDIQSTMLLGLKYEELSWEYATPSREDNIDCLPCLFIQFLVLENGARVSKILQVFSRQARMMDTLISGFVDQIKKKNTCNADEVDHPLHDINLENESHVALTGNIGRRDATQSVLSNKLSRLTLCTFDEEGRCIGQMGSWSFGY